MKNLVGYILAAWAPLAWSAQEVASYTAGLDQAREDGWVLLCHSADWDETHNEQWMRRQTSISSACGNALLLYVPIYQNPTPEQAAAVDSMLEGAAVNLSTLRSVPCAILLDQNGIPYATISGDDFLDNAAGLIRQSQAALRTRNSQLRNAAALEGTERAQALSSIWRLSIAPPRNLQEMMQAADPTDSAGIAEWSPFDPWALAERVRALPWPEAIAELERVAQAPLSKEERQAVLAIRLGCVRQHLGAAGAREIRNLAATCAALAPGTPLGKAAERASSVWGTPLNLSNGWTNHQLPRVAAECELAGARQLSRSGEYRICFIPEQGKDPVRITRVTLYDGESKVSEDIHTCCLKAGEPLKDNEYMLILRFAPTHPRLVVAFDQQGRTDTRGSFALRYFNEDGIEEIKTDPNKAAADDARKRMAERNQPEAAKTPEPVDPAKTAEAKNGAADTSPAEPSIAPGQTIKSTPSIESILPSEITLPTGGNN